MLKRIISLVLSLSLPLFLLAACSGDKPNELSGNLNELTSEPGDIFAVFEFRDYGEVTFKLFPAIAPVAVENFVAFAERGYYDNRNIHRVLKDYFFQGGSVNFDGTDGAVQDGEYFKIETSEYAKHFYGALCFAADEEGNNYRQFYVVCNKNPVDIDADIAKLEAQMNDKTKVLTEEALAKHTAFLDEIKAIPENIKELYNTRGGVYKLDGKSTVFGQVTEGQEVIDAIANAIVVAGNQIDDASDIESKPLDEIILQKVTIVRIPYPEPTTLSSEEATKKTKKPKETTTVDPNSPDALTDKVNLGDTTTPDINDDDDIDDSDSDTNSEIDTSTSGETSTPDETSTVSPDETSTT